MSTALLSAVTAAYAIIAALEFWNGNNPVGVVFFGYALANLGLMAGLS
jgi:hypothetical protein